MDESGLSWVIEIIIPTDTLNGGEDEKLAKMAKDLNKRFRLVNGKLLPVDPITGKTVEIKLVREVRQPVIPPIPKAPQIRNAETLPQKIILTLEVILRALLKWK